MDLNVTKGQIDAALRHVYTSAGTVLTIGTVLAVVPADSVQPIITELQNIGDNIQSILGSIAKLSILVGPIIGAVMAKLAFKSASPKSQGESLAQTASIPTAPGAAESSKTTEAKVALLTAVTDVARKAPDVNIDGTIKAAPEIAHAVPSAIVVPDPAVPAAVKPAG